MKKTIAIFGGLVLAILLLFQLSKYSLISGDLKVEYLMALIAIIFFVIGIFINKKRKENDVGLEYQIDQKKINELGLSSREYEVLVKVAEGLSNKEIADTLFISENTIKTHVSNVLIKLNAKRRTQAVQIAKDFKII